MLGLVYDRQLTSRLRLSSLYHENWDLNGGFGKKKGSNLFYTETSAKVVLTETFTIRLPGLAYGGSWDDPYRPRKLTWLFGFAKTF